MLTDLGKFLRKMRLDKGLLLKNMADQINYTPAFLSAVETGRKLPPDGFAQRVISTFGLSGEVAQTVQRLCAIKPVKLTPHTLDQSMILEGLARRLNDLDAHQVAELKKLLGGNSNESH